MNYQPGIDGLRGLAILAVIGYHYFPQVVPGGYVGVDIFFVISGYLITSKIIADIHSGDFSMLGFWNKRIRRIVPALVATMLICLAVGWISMSALDYKSLGNHAKYGSTFLLNLLVRKEVNYFDAESATKPLLHLWSLSVEEQFYIFWPLTLYAFSKVFRSRRFELLILAIATVSIGIFMVLLASDQMSAFYHPASRAWEFMAGSLASQIGNVFRWVPQTLRSHLHQTRKFSKYLLTVTVVLLITIAMNRLDHIFFNAIAPVAASFVIIVLVQQGMAHGHLLTVKPLVAIGLVSYSMYLIHWPLLVYCKLIFGTELSAPALLGLLALCTFASILMYRYVENPFRALSFKPSVNLSCAGLLVIFVFGSLIFNLNGVTFRDGQKNAFESHFENSAPAFKYFARHKIEKLYRDECNFVDTPTVTVRPAIALSCIEASGRPSIFLWGDSYAQHFYFGLRASLPSNVSISQVTSSGCWPHLDAQQPNSFGACNKSNRFALDNILRLRPNIVVLAQNREHEKNNYAEISSFLLAHGIQHVVVIGPTPQWNPYLYKVISENYLLYTPRRISKNLIDSIFDTDARLKESLNKVGVKYISILDHECNKEGCTAYTGDDVLSGIVTFDNGHLTPDSSLRLGREILTPALFEILQAQQL